MNTQPHDHIDTLSLFCINVIMALVLAMNYFGIQALIAFGLIGAFGGIGMLMLMLYEVGFGRVFSIHAFVAKNKLKTS